MAINKKQAKNFKEIFAFIEEAILEVAAKNGCKFERTTQLDADNLQISVNLILEISSAASISNYSFLSSAFSTPILEINVKEAGISLKALANARLYKSYNDPKDKAFISNIYDLLMFQNPTTELENPELAML